VIDLISQKSIVMKILISILLFFASTCIFAQTEVAENFSAPYIVLKQASQYFKEERTLKIHTPQDYDSTKKYPVIYSLDGDELFEITVAYSRFLIKYGVIPPCIVVGVFHNNRNNETTPNYGRDVTIKTSRLLKGAENLQNHLYNEVIPLINKKYSVSGYNILLGHSNTATLASQMIAMPKFPFNGVIAITPDLLPEQVNFVKEALIKKREKNIYFFVASGLKDNPYRLKTGQKLDSIFSEINSEKIVTAHKIYNADHLDLVVKSLNDALQFVFVDYGNYHDFKVEVINGDRKISTYLKEKSDFNFNNYGIAEPFSKDDYYYLQDLITEEKNSELLEQLFEIGEAKGFLEGNEMYSFKAQSYEAIENYSEALKNWKLQLNKGYFENVFYFERPFKLLYEKLNQPKEAISFLEKAIGMYPKGELVFRYYIAKVCSEKHILISKGLENIDFCINNFEENRKFDLKDAMDIKLILNN